MKTVNGKDVTGKKINSILKNVILLTIGTIFSKILGFGRVWIIAYKYGAGAISDAFTLTNSIPTTLFVSLGTAIGINYIPICSECETQNKKNQFTSNILGISTMIMLIGIIIIEIACRQIIHIFAPGINEETEYYAVKMLRIVVFSIFSIIYTHIFQGYAQINGKFNMTSVNGVITNIIIILAVVISNQETFYLLSIGYVLAYVLGMLACFVEARKNGFLYQFVFDIKDSHIKRIIVLTLPLMVEDASSSLSLVVDKILASYLESGTISALGYASTLASVASSMISSAIITATYPVFSKLIADNKNKEFNESARKFGLIISLLLVPIAAFMLLYSKEITMVIFEHGAFGNAATKIVWESMACYAIGIIPCGIQSYYVRIFYSLQDTKLPVNIKVAGLLCNIILNIILVKPMKHMGIALSTSISYLFAMILLSMFLEKKYRLHICKGINLDIIKKSLIALLLCSLIRIIIGSGIKNSFINIIMSGCVFVMGYIMITYLTLDKESRQKVILKIKQIKESHV